MRTLSHGIQRQILLSFLGRPYGLVLHGAEITVPGRLPGLRSLLGRVLRGAQVVVAAGGYPLEFGTISVSDGISMGNTLRR